MCETFWNPLRKVLTAVWATRFRFGQIPGVMQEVLLQQAESGVIVDLDLAVGRDRVTDRALPSWAVASLRVARLAQLRAGVRRWD